MWAWLKRKRVEEKTEKMGKIEEMEGYGVGKDVAMKLNEVIRAVNNLKCVEEEVPIYETLNHNDVLIISKDEEGLLVASNHLGDVQLKRVKYPEVEEEDKKH